MPCIKLINFQKINQYSWKINPKAINIAVLLKIRVEIQSQKNTIEYIYWCFLILSRMPLHRNSPDLLP